MKHIFLLFYICSVMGFAEANPSPDPQQSTVVGATNKVQQPRPKRWPRIKSRAKKGAIKVGYGAGVVASIATIPLFPVFMTGLVIHCQLHPQSQSCMS